MVQKDGSSAVSTAGNASLELGEESRCVTFYLIDRDTFPRTGGGVDFASIDSAFDSPRLASHGAIFAARTHGGAD